MNKPNNIYIPAPSTISDIKTLAKDIKLYTLNPDVRFSYRPGQFLMVSAAGFGEVPISITSVQEEHLMLCIRKAGAVTSAIHDMDLGGILGIRGPYGNGFPLDASIGRDAIVMAGGLGIAPLRPLIMKLIQQSNGRKVYVIYGTKTPKDILYEKDADKWMREGTSVLYTVDCADAAWKGCIGLATSRLNDVDADFKEACAYVCGPHVMISASLDELRQRGVPEDRVFASVEAHMKCGVGKCGHCYMGKKYACTDGPVFSASELKSILPY